MRQRSPEALKKSSLQDAIVEGSSIGIPTSQLLGYVGNEKYRFFPVANLPYKEAPPRFEPSVTNRRFFEGLRQRPNQILEAVPPLEVLNPQKGTEPLAEIITIDPKPESAQRRERIA